jgi:hypothetical protein
MEEEYTSIELKELKNLNLIKQVVEGELNFILERFRSRFATYRTWAPLMVTELKRLTDLGTGAERVFNFVICRHMGDKWSPVSIPFGSNLFFESEDAFINIDVKTVYADNTRDYGGLVEVGEAQTTYLMKNKWGCLKRFDPKLKPFYEVGDVRKPCLTYIIQEIHVKPEDVIEKRLDANPVALNIISVPNGLLYDVYGERIVGYPKSYHYKKKRRFSPANFRYYYHKEPRFKLLKEECAYKIRMFFNKNYDHLSYRGIVLTPTEITKIRKMPSHIISLFE